ncbi:MAG: hypothetical protein Q7S83_01050 [bacterium]|nr:hypothetical protein [bacterium]
MLKKKTFYKNGPNAVKELEEAVEDWLDEMDDKIEIEDIQEFEDENAQGKITITVISYRDLPADG